MKSIFGFLIVILASSIGASAQSAAKPSGVDSAKSEVRIVDIKEPAHYLGNVFEYLAKAVKIPPVLEKGSHSGKAYVQFIVLESGLVDSVTVLKSSGFSEWDSEAVRVVNAMNPPSGRKMWAPALSSNGVPVKSSFTLPIAFSIDY